MEIVSVIKKPRLTEKTQIMRTSNPPKMAFLVDKRANKHQITNAFFALFGVRPIKVNTLRRKPAPTRFMNNRRDNYSKLHKVAYITVNVADLENMQKGDLVGDMEKALQEQMNSEKK